MADSIIVARRDFLQNYVKQFQNGKWKFIWEMLCLKLLKYYSPTVADGKTFVLVFWVL